MGTSLSETLKILSNIKTWKNNNKRNDIELQTTQQFEYETRNWKLRTQPENKSSEKEEITMLT